VDFRVLKHKMKILVRPTAAPVKWVEIVPCTCRKGIGGTGVIVTFIHNPGINLEVSGQLHGQAVFTPWKKPQVPTE